MRRALTIAAAVGILWLGDATAQTLTPVGGRLTDEVIAADVARMDAWQKRLDALRETRPPVSTYHRVKAQAWLHFARREYGKNDLTAAAEEAFGEATRLIQAMETRATDPGRATPLVAGARRVRPDLWNFVEEIHRDPGFDCVAAEVALMELELVSAGHETQTGNPCQAEPHLDTAVRLSEKARAGAADCRPVAAPPPPPPPVHTPEEIQRQIEKLPKFVHFAFDSYQVIDKTAEVLTQVARVLHEYPQIQVALEGHADKRGSVEYNLKLSQRRAQAAYDFLLSHGIEPARLDLRFVGKSQPREAGEDALTFARNRCVIFRYATSAPVRGNVELQVVPQERDLQLERAGP